MIKLVLEFASKEQLLAYLNGSEGYGRSPWVVALSSPLPEPAPPKKGKRGRPSGSKTTPQPVPAAEPATPLPLSTSVPVDLASVPVLSTALPMKNSAASSDDISLSPSTIDQARALLLELNKLPNGYARCQAVMKELAMPRVSALAPDEIPVFMAAVQKEIDKK